jgi:hypothetical protein
VTIGTTIEVFVCLLAVTVFCSFKGDDDVVYHFFDRKPTGREALIRIRWVVLKTITSVYGGALLAVACDEPAAQSARLAFGRST